MTFLLALGLMLAVLAQDDPRAFADTGYAIADDAIWTFFNQYGGASTFGEPISREFTLLREPVQIFQNAALEVQSDGSVQVMQLTRQGLLPYTSFAGLRVPAADAATAFIARSPDQPNYAARLQVFLQTVVSEPFLSAFSTMGGMAVWGLPTSSAKPDPNNPNFTYQRFQNGILFCDAAAGTTQPLAHRRVPQSNFGGSRSAAGSGDRGGELAIAAGRTHAE